MKSILKPVLTIILTFFIVTLTSCSGNQNNSKNTQKYNLFYMSSLGEEVNIEETYNYYYIEFKKNGEVAISYNKKSDNIDKVEYSSYTKTENVYIANVNGLVLNYIIKDEGKTLECDFLVVHMVFKLEN